MLKEGQVQIPLVSIITPSYNQSQFIERCILSVLNQDYPNIEYLVVDGGSNDNTIEILKKYGDRVKWISEPDKGQSDAINKGFRMAKGDIVAWLNSDDKYLPGAVSEAVNILAKDSDIVMVYGKGYEIDTFDNIVNDFEAAQDFDLWKLIYVWDYILQPTVFLRKKALEDVGYLDINLNWCMDWDLWIRIGKKYKVAYINKYIAASRVYSDTKTSKGGLKRFQEITRIMRTHGNVSYPPGYFIYGVDTIDKLLENKFGLLYNYIFKYLMRLLRRLSSVMLYKKQGIYKDGWVLKKSNFLLFNSLAGRKQSIFLQMSLVNIFPVKIKVLLCGVLIDEININTVGEYCHLIKLSDQITNKKIIDVRLIADRIKRLSDSDSRKAAFLLKQLKIVSKEEEQGCYI